MDRARLRFAWTLPLTLIAIGCASPRAQPIRTADTRPATHADLMAIERLAELHRRQDAGHHRPMWEPASDAWEKHMQLLRHKIRNADSIMLVHDGPNGIDGYIIADCSPAPSVYDPGGLTCLVDDFVVDPPSRWSSVGQALLTETRKRAVQLGCAQIIVVCAEHDSGKRRLLRGSGLRVASQWYMHKLP